MTVARGGWLVVLACVGGWGCAPAAVQPSSDASVGPGRAPGAAPLTGPAPTMSAPAAPQPVAAAASVSRAPAVEALTSDMIRDVVRANYDKMAACYQRGLTRDPTMKGTIEVSLAIDGDGSVVDAKVPPPASEIRDADVVGCVVGEFQRLRFPASRRGLVNTVYPIVFAVE